jgi:hypothetical protein
VDQAAGAAERPEPLHLVRDPNHATTPRLNVDEVRAAADVGKRVILASVIGGFALV